MLITHLTYLITSRKNNNKWLKIIETIEYVEKFVF